MQIWKKALVVLVLASTVMGLAATQYAKLGISATAKVSTPESLIQLMAGDGAVVGSGYVLKNNNGVYEVNLGTFAQGFNKSYSAAFAIVNVESNVKLRITKIDIPGTGTYIGTYAVVTLHKKMASNPFVDATDGYIVYYDKGNSYDHSSNGYVLYNGTGTYTTGSPFKCTDGTDWETATWDSTNNVWLPPAHVVDATGLDITTSSTANFVWVQITLDFTSATASADLSGTIYIYVQSV